MTSKEKALVYLDDLDVRLGLLIKRIHSLHSAQLNIQPTAGSWSILQVMDHLRQSEALSLRYIKYKIEQGTVFPRAGMRASVRSFILNNRLKSSRKIKAPDLNGLSPKLESMNLDRTVAAWKQNRKELRKLLTQIDDGLYRKAIYKHPGLGRLSLRQMLSFFSAHFDRHSIQIDKVIEAVAKK